jgi:hypothetical protein
MKGFKQRVVAGFVAGLVALSAHAWAGPPVAARLAPPITVNIFWPSK